MVSCAYSVMLGDLLPSRESGCEPRTPTAPSTAQHDDVECALISGGTDPPKVMVSDTLPEAIRNNVESPLFVEENGLRGPAAASFVPEGVVNAY